MLVHGVSGTVGSNQTDGHLTNNGTISGRGVDSPPASVVNGVAEAVLAANRLGYPVVLKAADPALVHKSDRHLVRVGIGSPAEVHSAVSDLGVELGDPMAPLLVQAQVLPECLDRVAVAEVGRKDLCPACLNYLQAQRSTLGVKSGHAGSPDPKGGPAAA